MYARQIYRGDSVTESPHVYNSWEPKHPWDIHPELRNADMFSLTHELSYYRMRAGTSARFPYSMKGFINCLRKIGNHVSEAFKVFCIVQSLLVEYSPYIFKLMETCEEPMLMEFYEVMCKAEDDLRINPPKKLNKHNVNDEENDEQSYRRKARLVTRGVNRVGLT
ncbi:hypothetical protein Tco_1318631 [Tanacetum coccineum]